MGLGHAQAAATVNRGDLSIFQFPHIGLVWTQAYDDFVTDSAAAATAMATGTATRRRYLGLDPAKKTLRTIFDYAQEKGLATGMVVTTEVVDATPAAFYAHVEDRSTTAKIAKDFAHSPPDVFIGGGRKYLQNPADGINFLDQLKQKGHQIATSNASLQKIRKGKIAALLWDSKPPTYREGRKDFLPNAVKKALEILEQNESGFLLVVEGSQIDWAGHDQNLAYAVEETLDFDRAVQVARCFALRTLDTLVLVTADHESGGLTLKDGNRQLGKIEGQFHFDIHTGIMVPMYALGPGAQTFAGVFKNTDIFSKTKYLLNL